MTSRQAFCLSLAFTLTLTAFAPVADHAQAAALTPGELRATRAFDAAKALGTPDLYAFLRPMPKAGELHYHLGGGVYAETFLSEAARQGLCIDPVTDRYAPRDADKPKDSPCPTGAIPVSEAVKDQKLYDKLIDVFSMRSFVPTPGFSGHDQFFNGFRANGPTGFMGEWLAEATTRAAAQNEQYMELMTSPSFRKTLAAAAKMDWPFAEGQAVSSEQLAPVLATLREALLASGLRDEIAAGSKEMNEYEATQRQLEHCASPTPGPLTSHSPCDMKIHYLYTAIRSQPPQVVFAAILLGCELAAADPRFVGVNIAAPEDGRVSMRDYHLHMQFFDYLHSVYPQTNFTLHAGELAPGLVPPEGLRSNIRQAVELGHAKRIGHGVDVLYEDDAQPLLAEMAAKHIMVEINLTSNDGILGVKGKDHPLSGYRAAHVPVALSSDDEGVSRIDLTHEYVKAAEEQNLTYIDLKQMARTQLEHAFLNGESLWSAPDDFTHRKPACAAPIAATSTPTPACDALLKASERAAEQWELERRFAVFEDSKER
jgi:adenosine deaminase